ncbi:MAG: type III polyketide synthase [Sphingomonas sp.]|nr:MAG: type III polyketide synthase [Sphingomonas sp.]
MSIIPHIVAVGTAVPGHDIHAAFIAWARARLPEARSARVFDRMAGRAAINHRWSVLPVSDDGGSPVDPGGFYARDILPGTAERMKLYAAAAPALALEAIAALGEKVALGGITHLVVASCTGFVAPGIDQIIAARLGLSPTVERLLVGFMGCYAAVAALRSARHIVRSDPAARVLVVCVELSTLHLQDTPALDTDQGFAMHLSGEVPARIAAGLADPVFATAATGGRDPQEIDGWAVHAGGRSILDAVETALSLPHDALATSRGVLADVGNMSSATLMFVLARLLDGPRIENGVALAFGPGLAAEGFGFRSAG